MTGHPSTEFGVGAEVEFLAPWSKQKSTPITSEIRSHLPSEKILGITGYYSIVSACLTI